MLDYAMPQNIVLDRIMASFKDDLISAGYKAEQKVKDPRTAYAAGIDILVYFVIGAVAGGFFAEMGKDIYKVAKAGVRRPLLNLKHSLAQEFGWFRILFMAKEEEGTPDSRITVKIHVYDERRALTDDSWEQTLDFLSKDVYAMVHDAVSKGDEWEGMIEIRYDGGKWKGMAIVHNSEWKWYNIDFTSRKIVPSD